MIIIHDGKKKIEEGKKLFFMKKIIMQDFFKQIWFLSVLGTFVKMIPWSIIFIFLKYFKIRLYHIQNKDECRRIQKRIGSKCTLTMDDNMGAGYGIGRWYLIWIDSFREFNGQSFDIWLIATENSYREISRTNQELELDLHNNNDDCNGETDNSMEVCERMGSFSDIYYRNRVIPCPAFQPFQEQKIIMDKIKTHFLKSHHTVSLLYGHPGTGKSAIGLLLAKELKATYCTTFYPLDPGDSIAKVHSNVEPTIEKPLIIAMDEFDQILDKLSLGVPSHPKLPISVANKQGWNKLMDQIQWGLYPNIILLLTTNLSKEVLERYDPSFLREGRMDMKIPMKENILKKLF